MRDHSSGGALNVPGNTENIHATPTIARATAAEARTPINISFIPIPAFANIVVTITKPNPNKRTAAAEPNVHNKSGAGGASGDILNIYATPTIAIAINGIARAANIMSFMLLP